MTLPKSLQKGVKGPVICVPANMKSVNHLPRTLSDSALIKLKLKRNLNFKSYHVFMTVSPSRIKKSLKYLVKHNPYYADVTLGEYPFDESDLESPQFPQDCAEHLSTDISAYMNVESSHSEETEEFSDGNDNTDEFTQETDKNSSAPNITCLQADELSPVLFSEEDDSYSIAPGQKSKPCSIFNMECQAFPSLFPDGKNSFTDERPGKLGLGHYINSRLFSSDLRFAGNCGYNSNMHHINEVQTIRNSISIAFRKSGNLKDIQKITWETLNNPDNRRKILKANEGYRIFRSIRGSPLPSSTS